MEIKDSGKRRDFGTGSIRDAAEGKGRFDLLPEYAIQILALHYEMGAKKYTEDNWRKGQPLKTYLDSALRHLFRHSRGERDEPHLAAAAWNIMCLIDTAERIKRGLLPKELDNLRPVVPDSACGNCTLEDKPQTFTEEKLDQLVEDIRKIHSPNPDPTESKALDTAEGTIGIEGEPSLEGLHPIQKAIVDYVTRKMVRITIEEYLKTHSPQGGPVSILAAKIKPPTEEQEFMNGL
jgi:hypothetical protein